MKRLRVRLGLNFGAQIYSQLVTIVVQLALIPTLLHAWGDERYGIWLMIAAVPTYMTFSDFGFTFIAKNEMVMAVTRGDRVAATTTFHSVFALLCLISPVLLVLAAVVVGCVDLASVVDLGGYPASRVRLALFALIFDVFLYQQLLLLCSGVRCTTGAAIETVIAASSRLAEGLVIGGIALCGGDMVMAALAVVINRCLFLAGVYAMLRWRAPWLKLGFAHATRSEVRRLLRPSVSYMLVPTALAFAIQGPTLIVGSIIGPVAAVVYSSSRTLARMGTSAMNMLNYSFQPEYAEVWERGDRVQFRSMISLHLRLAALGLLAFVLVILAFDQKLIGLLTSHHVKIVQPFFRVLVFAVCAEMAWSVAFAPLSGINRHTRSGYVFFAASCFAIALTYPLTALFGLTGAVCAIAGIHVVMLVTTSVSLTGILPGSPTVPDPHAPRVGS